MSSDLAGRVPPAAQLGRPLRILLVDDSYADAQLTLAGLRRGRVTNEVFHVGGGEDALAFLNQQPPYDDVQRPDLVLLDLNMPRVDGREVLAAMKQSERLRRIPVIVLTTSAHERDVNGSYDLAAAGYVTKPVAFDDFVNVVRSLEGFWLSVVHYSPG